MNVQPATLPALVGGTALRLRALRDALLRVRTLYVLATLAAVQWLGVLGLALTVKHNGWLYYAGGDQLWHYSGAYLLAHGHLPPAFVGYGWSLLLLPVAAIAGPNLVSALPAIVLFNTLVLLPVALLCVYGIAARIAGRLFGYWAAAVWIAIPYLGILFVEPGYHQKYTELTLPQQLGLTSVPDFPATVALVVAAYFCIRAFDTPGWVSPAVAGLASGYSIAMKPSNSIFLAAPVLAFLFLHRRSLIPFALALAPPLLTLALWKYRGLGELAAAPVEPMRSAGAIDLLNRIHNAGQLNSWEHLHQVLLGLREHFWAARVIEWLPLAGMVALAVRSRRALLLVGAWFAAYLLAKGTYIPASIEDASFFRILMPAFPAYALLGAAVVLLVPGARARPAGGTFSLQSRKALLALGVAAAVFVVAPLGVVAATPPLHDSGQQAVSQADNLVPVTGAIALRATVDATGVHLSWQSRPSSAVRVFYRVLRAHADLAGPQCAGRLHGAADNCLLQYFDSPGATHGTSFLDDPGHGSWTYRIGVSANWLDDVNAGDVYEVSTPVTVTVP